MFGIRFAGGKLLVCFLFSLPSILWSASYSRCRQSYGLLPTLAAVNLRSSWTVPVVDRCTRFTSPFRLFKNPAYDTVVCRATLYIPCHTISYRTTRSNIGYHTNLCHAIKNCTASYHTTQTLPYYTKLLPYQTMPCLTVPYRTLP